MCDALQFGLIHDGGEEGLVLRAKCTKPSLPNKERMYTMKVLTNYFQCQTQTQVLTTNLLAVADYNYVV